MQNQRAGLSHILAPPDLLFFRQGDDLRWSRCAEPELPRLAGPPLDARLCGGGPGSRTLLLGSNPFCTALLPEIQPRPRSKQQPPGGRRQADVAVLDDEEDEPGEQDAMTRLVQLERSARQLAAAIRQLAVDLDRDERELPHAQCLAVSGPYRLDRPVRPACVRLLITDRLALCVGQATEGSISVFSFLENKSVKLAEMSRRRRSPGQVLSAGVTEERDLVVWAKGRLYCVALSSIYAALDQDLASVPNVRVLRVKNCDSKLLFAAPHFVGFSSRNRLHWIDVSGRNMQRTVDLYA